MQCTPRPRACTRPGGLLDAVLRLRLGDGLPLHVCRRVGAAAIERDDVVDDVARAGACRFAGRRVRVLALELPEGGGAARSARALCCSFVAGLAAGQEMRRAAW